MNKIFLSSPHMGGKELEYIQEAFDSNWIAPLGKNVNEFEKEICSFIGRPYSVAFSSGTAAIHLGLKYLGVGEGDIVFCQSFTFSGSCNPVMYLGARLVFIDSELDSWNMCPESLEKAYTKYPHPKAVIIVNLYGQPAKFEELLAITQAHGTPVLEDAAESLGAIYKGTQTGNFGDMSAFSFNGNKIITTSGGGMIMVNNEETRQKLLFWATQSRENYPWYQHEEVGYNYRLSNICAGIGRGQLKVLKERVSQKRRINQIYKEELAYTGYVTFAPVLKDTQPNHWLTVISLAKTCKATFMDVINGLAEENMECRPAWKPMHMQPIFKENDFIAIKKQVICEDLFSRSLCLPSDTKMSEEDVRTVAHKVNQIIAAKQG